MKKYTILLLVLGLMLGCSNLQARADTLPMGDAETFTEYSIPASEQKTTGRQAAYRQQTDADEAAADSCTDGQSDAAESQTDVADGLSENQTDLTVSTAESQLAAADSLSEDQTDSATIVSPLSDINGDAVLLHASWQSNHYAGSTLNDAEKQLYDLMDQEVSSFAAGSATLCADTNEYVSYQTDFTDSNHCFASVTLLGVCLTADQVKEAFYAFYYDHPAYYWLSSSYAVQLQSGGEAASSSVFMYIDSEYYRAAGRQETDAAIGLVSSNWEAEISASVSAGGELSADDIYKEILALHDLIIESVDYSYNSSGQPEDSKWAHSIAGVFTGEGAVCEAYARSFQYMLNKLGIDNVYIVGVAGTGSSKGGHAWNAVQIGEKWYLCDLTWDDTNGMAVDYQYPEEVYDYLCMPSSMFDRSHTAGGKGYWMCDIPECSDGYEYQYYTLYGSVCEAGLSSSNVQTFMDMACSLAPGEFVYFVGEQQYVKLVMAQAASVSSYYSETPYGWRYIYPNISVTYPADEVKLYSDGEFVIGEISLALGESLNMTAEAISAAAQADGADCDDRLIWTVSDSARLVMSTGDSGQKIFTAKGNGQATITVRALKSGYTACLDIVMGNGGADYVIWKNGSSSNKSVTLETTLTAGTWTDSSGHTKQGKISWIVLSAPTDISFDSERHTLQTKSEKTHALVSSKGKVTARDAGMVYIYACETASMTYEEFTVEVRVAPSIVRTSLIAGATLSSEMTSKVGLETGQTGTIYIYGTASKLIVDSLCSYSVVYAKNMYADYLEFTQPYTDSSGNISFTVTGKDFNREKGKVYTAKLYVINTESGKKATLTVVIGNTVTDVAVAADSSYSGSATLNGAGETCYEGALATKQSTISLALTVTTMAGGKAATTDTLKLYVSQTEAELNAASTKVTVVKGATVKASYNKNTGLVTLKANSDAGVPAVIYAGYRNAITKETALYMLATVDEEGNVTLK